MGHTLGVRTAPQAEALGLQASGEDGAQNLCSFRQMRTGSSLPRSPSTPSYQLTSLDPDLVGDP